MLGVDSLTTGIQDAFEFDENGYVKVLAEGISLTTGDITLDMTTTDGKLDTVNTNLGTLEDDVEAGNALLTTIDEDTSALAGTVSSGKILVTETSASGIKTSVDSLATTVSSGKLLVTETNSGSVKTAVEATKTNSDTLVSDLATVKADIATLKGIINKTLTAAGTQTSTGTVTVSGSRLQVTNLSDTAGMTFTVGAITVTLDVNEASPIFDTSAFTQIVFTQSSGMVASYKVWS